MIASPFDTVKPNFDIPGRPLIWHNSLTVPGRSSFVGPAPNFQECATDTRIPSYAWGALDRVRWKADIRKGTQLVQYNVTRAWLG